MPSSVHRQKAFLRGYERPQLFNPYRNPILNNLWKRGREAKLKKTGGVLPPLPFKRTGVPRRIPIVVATLGLEIAGRPKYAGRHCNQIAEIAMIDQRTQKYPLRLLSRCASLK
jgi:hypothetical protein